MTKSYKIVYISEDGSHIQKFYNTVILLEVVIDPSEIRFEIIIGRSHNLASLLRRNELLLFFAVPAFIFLITQQFRDEPGIIGRRLRRLLSHKLRLILRDATLQTSRVFGVRICSLERVLQLGEHPTMGQHQVPVHVGVVGEVGYRGGRRLHFGDQVDLAVGAVRKGARVFVFEGVAGGVVAHHFLAAGAAEEPQQGVGLLAGEALEVLGHAGRGGAHRVQVFLRKARHGAHLRGFRGRLDN